jgi:hypothetical protein
MVQEFGLSTTATNKEVENEASISTKLGSATDTVQFARSMPSESRAVPWMTVVISGLAQVLVIIVFQEGIAMVQEWQSAIFLRIFNISR